MKFKFGQKLAIRTKENRVEVIYPHMALVLEETDTNLVLLFPDGRVKINKADIL